MTKDREQFLPLHIGDDFVQHYLNRVFLYLSPTGYSDFSPETISRRDNIITSGYTFSHRRGDLGISYSEEGRGCGRLADLVDFASEADPHRRFAYFASLSRGIFYLIEQVPPDVRLFVGIKFFCCLSLLLPGGSVIAKKIKYGQPIEWKDLLSKDVADEWVLFDSRGFGRYLSNYSMKRLGFFTRGISLPLQVVYHFLHGIRWPLSNFKEWLLDFFRSSGVDIDYLISKLSGVYRLIEIFDSVSASGGVGIAPSTCPDYRPWAIDRWEPTFISLSSGISGPFFSAEDMIYCKKIIQGLTRVRLSLAIDLLRTIHEKSLDNSEEVWVYRPGLGSAWTEGGYQDGYRLGEWWEWQFSSYFHIFQFLRDQTFWRFNHGFSLLWFCWQPFWGAESHFSQTPYPHYYYLWKYSLINFDWDSSDELVEEYTELLYIMTGIFEVFSQWITFWGIGNPPCFFTGLLSLPYYDYTYSYAMYSNAIAAGARNGPACTFWYYVYNNPKAGGGASTYIPTDYPVGGFYCVVDSGFSRDQFYPRRYRLISSAYRGMVENVVNILLGEEVWGQFLQCMWGAVERVYQVCAGRLSDNNCSEAIQDIQGRRVLETFPEEVMRGVRGVAEYLVEIYSAPWRYERFKKMALSFVGSYAKIGEGVISYVS